ncbi:MULTISPECIES: transposase [Alteromonadaceae]|uniref:transposase n=1 Tax=Alteromonadaceae TaxID=72275 RepID=UPI00319DF180
MPVARKHQISLVDTPYYHCVSRCVRRAYLCGIDTHSGQNYEHRRQWVEDRLLLLTSVFCIDVCAYAVMNNHIHVVLHVNKTKALGLSDTDVIKNWQKIHKPTELALQFIQTKSPELNETQRQALNNTISIYRQRLFDISWFMRELNEPIARRANLEDKCTGHFWEGRFKSQALLDEKALTACMVYVDLNPIRAKIEATPETSSHTSIKRRIAAFQKGIQPRELMPFVSENDKESCLPLNLIDYISLVRETAKISNPSHDNLVTTSQQSILTKLNFIESTWFTLSHQFEAIYGLAAGSYHALKRFKEHTNRKRILSVTDNYY